MQEIEIQRKIEKETGYGHNKCKSGIIDILTPYSIIEIKRWHSWKHAVGQILCYHRYYPNRMMRIHFFGDHPPLEKKKMILNILCENNICATWENGTGNINYDIKEYYSKEVMINPSKSSSMNFLEQFITDKIEITRDKKDKLTTSQVFQVFSSWKQAQPHTISIQGLSQFGKAISSHLHSCSDKSITWETKLISSKTFHMGIKLKKK